MARIQLVSDFKIFFLFFFLSLIKPSLTLKTQKPTLHLDLTHSFSNLPGSSGNGRGFITESHQRRILYHDKHRANILHSRLLQSLVRQSQMNPSFFSKSLIEKIENTQSNYVRASRLSPGPNSDSQISNFFNSKLEPSSSETFENASSPSPSSNKVNGTTAGGANFPLNGNAEPQIAGLYWASIHLGNPAREFKVHIDSGSDILWVHCAPCTLCPSSSELISLAPPFNPSDSSESKTITCASQTCLIAQKNMARSSLTCSSNDASTCNYQVRYGDGSSTTGTVIQDLLKFPSLNGTEVSAKVNFGCGIVQTGNLYDEKFVVDGLMGLAQGPMSISSQLVSEGLTTDAFAHCLGGEESGGGRLIFGSLVDKNITYTPMLGANTRTFYYVEIVGMKVNDKPLVGVDSSSFGDIDEGAGVILDSGTTLSYFPSSIFNTWLSAVASYVSLPRYYLSDYDTRTCWNFGSKSNSELVNYFPSVTISFRGGDMKLPPINYLYFKNFIGSPGRIVCIGWDESTVGFGVGISVLGDMILRNHLIVYDSLNAQVGWKAMDCLKDSFTAIGNPGDVPLSISTINSSSNKISSNIFCLLFCFLSASLLFVYA